MSINVYITSASQLTNGYTISSNTNVYLQNNITITTTTQYFIIGGSNITVDGGYNVVTISNVTNFPGLFVTDRTSNLYTSIVIQHFGINMLTGINSVNSTCNNAWYISNLNLTTPGTDGSSSPTGGIDRYGNRNITLNYCSSNGTIQVECSAFFPLYSYGGNLNYCYNTGFINATNNNRNYSTSAFFSLADSSTVYGYNIVGTANNCYNTGATNINDPALPSPPSGNGAVYQTNCFNAGVGTSNGGVSYNASLGNSVSYIYWDELTAESALIGTPQYYNPTNNPPIKIAPLFGTTWISLAPSMPYILMSDNSSFNTVSYIQSILGESDLYGFIFSDLQIF